MAQPNPPDQVLRDGQDIPQHVYLKFIKRLIYCSLQQCLKLVQSIFNLQSRLRVLDIPIIIRVGDRIGRGVRESQALGGSSKKAGLETRYCLVDEVVYRVDDVVDEGLTGKSEQLHSNLGRLFCDHSARGEEGLYVAYQRRVAEVLSEQRCGRIVHYCRAIGGVNIFQPGSSIRIGFAKEKLANPILHDMFLSSRCGGEGEVASISARLAESMGVGARLFQAP